MLAKLDNEVIFKKAFTDKFVLENFVKDITGVHFEADTIETEKQFEPKVAHIDFKLDIYAESKDKRIVVELQRVEYDSHFDRFLSYFLALILEQQKSSKQYKIERTVYGIILLVGPYRIVDRMGNAIQDDVLIVRLNPTNLMGEERHLYDHQLHFLNPYHCNPFTPPNIKQWLDLVYASIHTSKNPYLSFKTPAVEKAMSLIQIEDLTSEEMESMKIQEETRIKKELDENYARAEGEAIGIQKGELKKGIASGLVMLEKGMDTKLIQEILQFSDAQMQILTEGWKNKMSIEEILKK